MKIEYDSSKEAAPTLVDTYVPPVDPWPRLAPDMLDIDLTGPRSIIAMSDVPNGPKTGGAKWLNGLPGVSGTGDPLYDNTGQVFHYSNLAGIAIPANGPACDMTKGWVNWDCKFTNYNTYPIVKWGVEPNGLHYLESGTDGRREVVHGESCRIIDWKAFGFSVRRIYWRIAKFACQETWDNDTELGIKMDGVGGVRANGGTFAEIFELGKKTARGWEAGTYRYDGEGDRTFTVFPGVEILPECWTVYEGFAEVETVLGAGDGKLAYKVNGVQVFARNDVKMGATAITGFNALWYHGGTTKPAGILRVKTAAIALSTKGWIGPPAGWP